MIDLPCSLIIEATDEPDFFGFDSPELADFSGVGHSAEDRLDRSGWGMKGHAEPLVERGLPVPPRSDDPTVLFWNAGKAPVA